jgi:hypothetical protein
MRCAAMKRSINSQPVQYEEVEEATRPDTVTYIAGMTAELARLARASRLDILAYLLEMASTEARQLEQRK